MLEILDDITEGRGTEDQLETLADLSDTISSTALCGLGKTAPNPIQSTLQEFKDEYLTHIIDKRCPTGTCQSLALLSIDPDKCKGCTKCIKACPTAAIKGEPKEIHVINNDKCIKCKVCLEACPFDAISLTH